MKLVQFIVCDDIRKETGNKFSLMGIYENAIEFRVTPDKKDKWPKTMRLGIYAKSVSIKTKIRGYTIDSRLTWNSMESR
jgi:hypothetical protein